LASRAWASIFVTSISNRELPGNHGTILLYAIVLVIANVVVDIVYAYLDPASVTT